MLIAGKGKHYYAETEGAVRYVVADVTAKSADLRG